MSPFSNINLNEGVIFALSGFGLTIKKSTLSYFLFGSGGDGAGRAGYGQGYRAGQSQSFFGHRSEGPGHPGGRNAVRRPQNRLTGYWVMRTLAVSG